MYLFDDQDGKSTYLWASSWQSAERMAVQYGYTLIGRSTGYQPGGGFRENSTDR